MDNTIYKRNLQMKIIWYKYDINYTEKKIEIEWSCNLREKRIVMHSFNTVKLWYHIRPKEYAPLKTFIDEFKGYWRRCKDKWSSLKRNKPCDIREHGFICTVCSKERKAPRLYNLITNTCIQQTKNEKSAFWVHNEQS